MSIAAQLSPLQKKKIHQDLYFFALVQQVKEHLVGNGGAVIASKASKPVKQVN
jgi:hypothetical protein